MKKLITIILSICFITNLYSQTEKLSGPRVGFTFIGAGPIADFINTKDLDKLDNPNFSNIGETGSAFITQYGWQWETRFADGYDVTGLVEWILLVGGIEKGLFLPSFSSLVGIRTSSNFEFAFGPNLSLSGVGAVVAIGKNFKVGELNLPINIAFRPGIKRTREFGGDTYYDSNTGEFVTTQQTTEEYNSGSLISLVIGFNIGN